MARDTPGRDALITRRARAKTLNMFGPGTRNERQSHDMTAALMHKGGYGNPLPAKTVMGEGPRGITQVDKLVGAKKFVSDAYWVATHPRDRMMGRGRSKDQQMMWAGSRLGPGGVVYNALKPSWRVPTDNPEWEIIRNKPGDLIVGQGGNVREYAPARTRSGGFWTPRRNRQQERLGRTVQSLAKTNERLANPSLHPDLRSELIGERRYYERALREAHEDWQTYLGDRRRQSVPMAFSAVRPGTREAHASFNMDIYPDKVSGGILGEVGRRAGMHPTGQPVTGPGGRVEYTSLDVPNPVQMQLQQNLKAPEKPIHTYFANRELAALTKARARGQGTEIVDEANADDFEWLPRSQRGPDYEDPTKAARDTDRYLRRAARLDRQRAEAARRAETLAEHAERRRLQMGSRGQQSGPEDPWAEVAARAAANGISPRQQWLQERAMRQQRRGG